MSKEKKQIRMLNETQLTMALAMVETRLDTIEDQMIKVNEKFDIIHVITDNHLRMIEIDHRTIGILSDRSKDQEGNLIQVNAKTNQLKELFDNLKQLNINLRDAIAKELSIK